MKVTESFTTIDNLESFHLEELKKFVHTIVRSSNFYKAKKLTDITTMADFEKLSPLSAADLRSTLIDDMRGADWKEIVTVTRSSGTTGNSKNVLWTQDAVDWDNYWGERLFRGLGLHSEDRFLLLMPLEFTRIGGWPAILNKLGVFVIPFGRIRDDIDAKNATTKAKELKPTVLCGSPSRIQSFTQDIVALGIDPKTFFNVRTILTGGTTISQTVRERLEADWGATLYDVSGANEISFLGFECERHHGMHLLPGPNYVEVVDENNQKIVDGSRGELLVTNYKNTGTPLLRYAIGDIGRILYEKCDCGSIFPRLFIDGRTVGTITLGGTKLHANDIEDVLINFYFLSNVYQVVVENDDGVTSVNFRVELNTNTSNVSPVMQKKVLDKLSQSSASIYSKIKNGKVVFSLSLVTPGTIPRSGADKIKDQFQDLRQ